MNRLFITADDLGLHADINRGIQECLDAGVVRGVSLCACGSALDWPRVASFPKTVRVGLHLALTGEPWLSDGRLIPDWRALLPRLSRGGAFLADCRNELRRQVQACLDRGIRLSHLDGHQHVHLLPGLWPACRELAAEFGIPRVRVPAAPRWSLARRSPSGLVLQAVALWRRRDVKEFLPCIGIARSGRNSLATLERELRLAAPDDVELIAHPGVTTPALIERYRSWNYDWSGERNMLCDGMLRDTIARHGYEIA